MPERVCPMSPAHGGLHADMHPYATFINHHLLYSTPQFHIQAVLFLGSCWSPGATGHIFNPRPLLITQELWHLAKKGLSCLDAKNTGLREYFEPQTPVPPLRRGLARGTGSGGAGVTEHKPFSGPAVVVGTE